MQKSRKKKQVRLLQSFRKWRLKHLKAAMKHKGEMLSAKAEVQRSSNSLLWVWEFSKKAVLICFVFYILVQVYSMVVMWRFLDFSSLPILIEKTADLTERCVFAYLIKAGLENIGKIWISQHNTSADDGNEPSVG